MGFTARLLLRDTYGVILGNERCCLPLAVAFCAYPAMARVPMAAIRSVAGERCAR